MFVLRFTVVLLMVAALSFGQVATGRIEGTVSDSSGAVVPGAKVTAVNTRTDIKTELTSTPEGQFTFVALQPGFYSLNVEATGFRKAVVSNIELTAGITIEQRIKLEVGQLTEVVMVEANAVRVETSDSQVARAVNLKDIDALPQLNRTPITLSVFQPGVQINPSDVSFSRINGMRIGSNNSKLDGIDINDSVVPRLGLSMTANNTDSIGEFRVVLGGGKAEYGRSAGGQVELVTRSGANQFHGNAFDYLRNTDLNANDFFNNQSSTARPVLIQNIFGGSLGGRIIRDKLFIFGNYQGRRTRQGTVRNRTVYMADAKAGIFKYRTTAGVQSYNFAAADPAKIGVDPVMAKNFAQVPLPNNSDIGDGLNYGGFRFNNPTPSLEDQYTIKGDWNATSTNHVFFRWSWQRNYSVDALNGADATFPGQPQGAQGGHRWGFSVGHDWGIKPTIVNELRIGYQRANADFLRPNRPQASTTSSYVPTDLYYTGFAQGRYAPVIDFTDNITWVKGKHVFKGGAQIRRTLQHGWNEGGIYPTVYTYSTQNGNTPPASVTPPGLASGDLSTFQNVYNDILGRVSNVTATYYSNLQTFLPQGTAQVRDFLFKEGGFFFQDDWKIARNLTLNLGVRYDYSLQPVEQNQLQGALDQNALVNGMTQINNLTVQPTSHWFNNDWNNFAPRLGLAWDVTGDGKTSVRANYGIFYDRAIGSVANGVDGSTPGFVQATSNYVNGNGGDVRVAQNPQPSAAPTAPVTTLPVTRSTSTRLFNPDIRMGYVQNYSFSVQREIIRNTVLEVGFVGNRGMKLFLLRDVNQPQIWSDFLPAFKQMQAFVANGTAPPAGNTLVRIYGTPQAAQSALGTSTFTQGLVGTAINALDVQQYARYTAAGISQNYVRNYPQFNQVQLGTNDGRSYYDSVQVSVRRQAGSVRMALNYTFSKVIDNVGAYSATSSAPEGNGYAAPIDNFNLRLMRGVADFNHTHTFNGSGSYNIPVGKGRRYGSSMPGWASFIAGGWDLGALMIWQTGAPFTVMSQRATGPLTGNTWANFTGDKNLGSVDRRANGVFFLTAENYAQFGYPGAGEFGTGGRNNFYGPRFFDVDTSIVKAFPIKEGMAVKFRAEAFNLFNNPNFGGMTININTPATFGRFSSTFGGQNTSTSARILQMTLRFEF